VARRRKRSYGSGNIVTPNVPGGPWGIRWRDVSGQHYRGGFDTRELAERVLARRAGELAIGRAGMPPDTRNAQTIGELSTTFLDRRDLTHRAADTDRGRWKNHVGPWFDHLKPGEVDTARIRTWVEQQLRDGLSSGTVRIHVALLSALFTDLVEQGDATANPVRSLPRATRRLIKPSHDPRTTPFIEKVDDVRRIFLALPEPLNIAYAIGALAGLRTGEVFALKWSHVDLSTRRIHVRESVKGPLKDKESRVVPVLTPLLPVLTSWKLKSGGEGLLVKPLRSDGVHMHKETYGRELQTVLKALKLQREGLGWYEATRHSFASQWVLAGGSIEKLKEMLGHYSVIVTERYAHLRPDLFAPKDLDTIAVDLAAGSARPTSLPTAETRATGTSDPHGPRTSRRPQIEQTLSSEPENHRAKPARAQRKDRSSPVSRVLSPRCRGRCTFL
jgi:integrase